MVIHEIPRESSVQHSEPLPTAAEAQRHSDEFCSVYVRGKGEGFRKLSGHLPPEWGIEVFEKQEPLTAHAFRLLGEKSIRNEGFANITIKRDGHHIKKDLIERMHTAFYRASRTPLINVITSIAHMMVSLLDALFESTASAASKLDFNKARKKWVASHIKHHQALNAAFFMTQLVNTLTLGMYLGAYIPLQNRRAKEIQELDSPVV